MKRGAILLSLTALVLSADAYAHGGTNFQKGFVSTGSAVVPNVSANVTGGDARLPEYDTTRCCRPSSTATDWRRWARATLR